MMQIPDHYIEIERIYAALIAGNIRSVAITSSQPLEGTSTLVRALARRSLIGGRSTLLVDLNLHSPHLGASLGLKQNSTLEPLSEQLSEPCMLSGQNKTRFAVINAPARRKVIMKLREPGILETHIRQWLTAFDVVILDTSPIGLNNSGNLPGEYAASACDACILMVLAGKTTEASVKNTLEKLKMTQALLLGTVFNDQFNPGLKQELLREVERITPYFPKLAIRLRHWLNNSNLLSLEL